MQHIKIRNGCVNAHNNKTHHGKGSGFKTIVHHRVNNTHDPNVERLKESLHQLSIAAPGRKSAGSGIKKPSKYIVF